MPLLDLTCAHCGGGFTRASWKVRYARVFCSHACYTAASTTGRAVTDFACGVCGSGFSAEAASVRNRRARGQTAFFCSRRCYEIDKSRDKPGRRSPYREVVRDGKRIYEHRWVMQQILDRPLRSDEIVHHINGDGLDNRPENLTILDASTHMREHNLLALPIERIKALREEGLSLAKIAKELGVSRTTITNRLRAAGLL